MTKRLLGTVLILWLGAQFQSAANASTLQLQATSIFEQSLTHNLQLSSFGLSTFCNNGSGY